MSISARIIQKGFFKYTITLNTILGNELSYGQNDEYYRMDFEKRDRKEFIVYNPNFPGRGINIAWDEMETHFIDLKLLNPTLTEEVIDFFNIIRRVSCAWKCNVEIDGSIVKKSELDSVEKEQIKHNIQSSDFFLKMLLNNEMDVFTMYSALFPICLKKAEAQRFYGHNDLFQNWLRNLQLEDVYYATPKFFVKNGDTVGVLIIVENTYSVLPDEPEVPDFVCDETGEKIECDNYRLVVCSEDNNESIDISYSDFLNELPKHKTERFDATHFKVLLSLSEMMK